MPLELDAAIREGGDDPGNRALACRFTEVFPKCGEEAIGRRHGRTSRGMRTVGVPVVREPGDLVEGLASGRSSSLDVFVPSAMVLHRG